MVARARANTQAAVTSPHNPGRLMLKVRWMRASNDAARTRRASARARSRS